MQPAARARDSWRGTWERVITPTQATVAYGDWATARHEDFADRNLWSLYNCVTEGLKKGSPARTLDRHTRAHAFFSEIRGPGDDIEACLGPRIVESDEAYDREVHDSDWALICQNCGDRLPFDRLSSTQLSSIQRIGLVEECAATSTLTPRNRPDAEIPKGNSVTRTHSHHN